MKFCARLMIFFNVIFFVVGMALIITGALVKTELSSYFQFYSGSATHLAVGLITIGCIIFIIAFFGCCGAWKDNYCMVRTFMVLLLVVMVLQIAAGIAAYVMRKPAMDEITEKMQESMKTYETEEETTKLWDSMQEDVKCCGADDLSDWFSIAGAGFKNDTATYTLPKSCCKADECKRQSGQYAATATPESFYQKGCKDGVISAIKDNIKIIGGVCIGLAFIQIAGIILACCLSRAIKDSGYETTDTA